jgi:hypothetical protein
MRIGFALGLIFLATTSLGGSAWADVSDSEASRSDPKAAAEALFEDGVELAEAGKLAEACRKFEASETLDVAVGTLLRLADCYERTGRLASAWARFREARSLAQAQSMRDRERIASQRADALDSKVQRLTINVSGSPPGGLRVELGNTLVPPASWGSAFPIDAGRVVVEASAPGYLPFRREIVIPAGDGARTVVEIPALEAELSAPQTARTIVVRSERTKRADGSRLGSVQRGVGVGLAVVGGVGLAASGVLAFVSARRNEASLEHCPESDNLCTPRGVALREEAGKIADYGTLSAAVGGGLLISGLVVYWAAPSGVGAEQVSFGFSGEPNGGIALGARGTF